MKNIAQNPQVLIGRHNECDTLKECLASNRSEFVIVCGRRRIGKTFLIDRFFENRYDFSAYMPKKLMKLEWESIICQNS